MYDARGQENGALMLLANLDRVAFVMVSGASTGGVFAMVNGLDEHATLIASLVSAVVVIAGGLAWLDRRMDAKMQAHEKKEFDKDEITKEMNRERYESRNRFEEERHRSILAEIAHVRDMLDLKAEIRKLREPHAPES